MKKNETNREGGNMKYEMASLLLDENMLCKVTFRYNAKILAGHCVYQMVWVRN
jgi:hypothetical protein